MKYSFLFTFFLFIISLSAFSANRNSVIEYRTDIKYKNYKLETTSFFEIQIDDKESDWISDIEIDYNINDEFELLQAEIYNMNGDRIRKIKKDEIVVKSSISDFSMYEDDMQMTFKLKWHEYPYRIRYSYKITRDDFLFVAYWNPVISLNTLTRSASLNVDLPLDYQIHIDSSGLFSYTEQIEEDRIIRKWSIENYLFTNREVLAPPVKELMPKVTIVPDKFYYGVEGSTSSWADYGKFTSDLSSGLDDLTASEKIKIDSLLVGVDDPKEKIAILYHHMQDNTRYVNVSIDIGGLKPYPASYVCINKYGDCKALTNYMKSILNYAGIKAYFVDVYAGDRKIKINRNFPSPQVNHVILCIPLENDTIWLENTSKTSPYNYLGTFTQDRDVLFINGEQSQLIHTPKLSLEDNKQENKYSFTLSESGDGIVNIKGISRGFLFEEYKNKSYYNSQKDLEKEIIDEIPLHHFDVMDIDLDQENRDTPEIKSEINLIVHKQIKKVGNSYIIKLPQLFDYTIEKNDYRQFPVRIPYPIKQIDSLSYRLSFIDKYTLQLPENVLIETAYGNYSEVFTKKGNVITSVRELIILSGEYPKEEYPEIYQFFQDVKNKTKNSFLLFEAI